ncbi:MATE family efflux transporter [Jannaschia aquimarina]|uniref:Multidrug-efflux transporter n=1 Tax=Jannaschia aquimarina TaxID=935700 RepID=A0A0D1ELP0_9RHOB|nr:MATE family efflux transporter [Jannaschia aquimarina]KIT17846.1 Multidrug resistance protein MdtK [Jannaschia aquimarina]SNS90141.1 multidrug resistance protein, MATE family [Jannaschia aquimarina]
MEFRQHIARTLTLGLPLVGSQVAQVLIGVTDTAMLGRYSVEALAAGTLGSTAFFTIYLLCSGFAIAVMSLASDAAGREDERSVRRAARMGLWLSVLAGLALMPVLLASEPILLALGQAPDIAEGAAAYLSIAAFGLIPALIWTTFRSHLSALERTRIVLWVTMAGVAVNILLNWLFIFGNLGMPELGVQGAALASAGVQVTMGALLALYSAKGPDMARWDLFRNLQVFDQEVFVRLARLGWPIGLTHVSEVGLFAAAALMMGALGTIELAAHGIAIQIAAAVFMVHLGLSQAATVRVGRFWGAADALGLRQAALSALVLSGIAVVLATAVYLGAGHFLIGLFLDRSEPDAPAILALGVTLLTYAALFQLVDALQVMALGFLRGMQDTRRPMIYAIAAYWIVGIPISYGLGFPGGMGPVGIWLGLVIGLSVAGIALIVRFWRMAPPVAPLPA